MSKITPVLLAGGSGTRLWPASRKAFPKQFAPLIGPESLFQASARRLSGPGYGAPVVMTNADFRFIVAEQLDQIGIKHDAIVIEPEGRNTAPAILAAALRVAETDPQALVLVAPSDHVIPDSAAFAAAATSAIDTRFCIPHLPERPPRRSARLRTPENPYVLTITRSRSTVLT